MGSLCCRQGAVCGPRYGDKLCWAQGRGLSFADAQRPDGRTLGGTLCGAHYELRDSSGGTLRDRLLRLSGQRHHCPRVPRDDGCGRSYGRDRDGRRFRYGTCHRGVSTGEADLRPLPGSLSARTRAASRVASRTRAGHKRR